MNLTYIFAEEYLQLCIEIWRCYLSLQGDIVSCAGTYIHVWSINGSPTASVNTFTGRSQQIMCCFVSEMNEWDTQNVILTGHSDGVVRVSTRNHCLENKAYALVVVVFRKGNTVSWPGTNTVLLYLGISPEQFFLLFWCPHWDVVTSNSQQSIHFPSCSVLVTSFHTWRLSLWFIILISHTLRQFILLGQKEKRNLVSSLIATCLTQLAVLLDAALARVCWSDSCVEWIQAWTQMSSYSF